MDGWMERWIYVSIYLLNYLFILKEIYELSKKKRKTSVIYSHN